MLAEFVITPLVIACVLGESLHNADAYYFTAWVIRNRVEAKAWPDDAEGVATQRLQFPAMNDPENVEKLLGYRKRHKILWEKAKAAIELAFIQRPFQDPTFGATHYVTETLYNSDRKGFWTKMRVTTVKHGHVYLAEPTSANRR